MPGDENPILNNGARPDAFHRSPFSCSYEQATSSYECPYYPRITLLGEAPCVRPNGSSLLC